MCVEIPDATRARHVRTRLGGAEKASDAHDLLGSLGELAAVPEEGHVADLEVTAYGIQSAMGMARGKRRGRTQDGEAVAEASIAPVIVRARANVEP